MKKSESIYENYLNILQEELLPALGCTEPISIAYASAIARDTLGEFPDEIIVQCSGNIVKNVKGVIVPTTGNVRGIEAAAILGAVAGNISDKLEVLSKVTPKDVDRMKSLLSTDLCKSQLLKSRSQLHIIVTASKNHNYALVEIQDGHTNVVRIEKNHNVLTKSENPTLQESTNHTDRTALTLNGILEFADTVEIDDVRTLLDRQIDYNLAIAKEGLSKSYGANVGSTLLKFYGDDIKVQAKAYAAAGSDARMSGCVLPVVINSGSGNQGMTVSLPVIKYANHLNVGSEKLYRALVVSNLLAIHQKSGIGKLSAYCGAVSAACGSGAAITYFYGGTPEEISRTIINTLANVSGIVCDGAKPSCAAKIASAVDAAIMAHHMSMAKQVFHSGEGIVKDTVEDTIKSVGKLGRDGMRETDQEILTIMIGSKN